MHQCLTPSPRSREGGAEIPGWWTVLAALVLLGGVARADDFVVGYNQAWQDGKFGTISAPAYGRGGVEEDLARTRESGGSVLRIWLFEGSPMDGVVFEKHRPAGVDPAFLAHVRRLGELCGGEPGQIY